MPGYGQCVAGASHCHGLRALPPCAAARRGFPGPLAPAHPGSPPTRDRPPRRSPRRPSPQNPPSCDPPAIARIRGEGLEKRAFSLGRFFWGGAVAASSLRRPPFGLRRSARDPWRQPGTRRVRSRAGRASRSLPRVSPDAPLARAHPHAAAFGGSAASAATTPATDNQFRSQLPINYRTSYRTNYRKHVHHSRAGDTPPRVELPRPNTGAAISPTPPDTGRPALPRARSAAAASQPYSAGPRVSSLRAPGVQSPGLPGLVLPPGRGSPPCVRRRTVTGGLSAEASRRKACHTPSSLRKLAAVSLWQAHRRFHIPGVAAAPLRVDGCHAPCHGLALAARACARHSGSGTGLPHGVERRYEPAHVWQALPGGASRLRLVAAARIRTATVPAAPLPQRHLWRPAHRTLRRKLLACRMRTPPHFISPVWQPPPLRVERLPRPGHGLSRAARARARHTGSGTGLPHGVAGR
jgi:hypothetical protein